MKSNKTFFVAQPVSVIKSRSASSLDYKNILCTVGITRVIPSPYNRLGYQKIFKEECNNSITLRIKNFFFLAAGAKQKFFSKLRNILAF